MQQEPERLEVAALDGRLHEASATWDPRPAIGVVLAAQGYPAAVRNGDVVHGLDAKPAPDTKVFHAGTRVDRDRVVTAGGRVLTVGPGGRVQVSEA